MKKEELLKKIKELNGNYNEARRRAVVVGDPVPVQPAELDELNSKLSECLYYESQYELAKLPIPEKVKSFNLLPLERRIGSLNSFLTLPKFQKEKLAVLFVDGCAFILKHDQFGLLYHVEGTTDYWGRDALAEARSAGQDIFYWNAPDVSQFSIDNLRTDEPMYIVVDGIVVNNNAFKL